MFTSAQVWKNMVGAFEGMAGAHDMMAENLMAEMNQPLDVLITEKRKQREGFLKELMVRHLRQWRGGGVLRIFSAQVFAQLIPHTHTSRVICPS